jgi:HPt (histidine-containing phosphotransfer) domain-containing protein
MKQEEILTFKYVDINQEFRNLINDDKLYIKLLKTFYNDYSGMKFEELDDETYSRTIHTLKGNSGNIGAIELYKIVALLDKSKDKTVLSEVYIELDKVLGELKKLYKIK